MMVNSVGSVKVWLGLGTLLSCRNIRSEFFIFWNHANSQIGAKTEVLHYINTFTH
jgi:hypothetical protein